MTIIQGTQICIPPARRRAAKIIERMHALLDARRSCRISRPVFLRQWDRLRRALRLTIDYRELIERVRQRCDGVCERCVKRPMQHVHHIEQVSFNPNRVLDDTNCRGLCRVCHTKEHK